MGTHPIFESDFDCLTENRKMRMLNLVLLTLSSSQMTDPDYSKTLFPEVLLDNCVAELQKQVSDDTIASRNGVPASPDPVTLEDMTIYCNLYLRLKCEKALP